MATGQLTNDDVKSVMYEHNCSLYHAQLILLREFKDDLEEVVNSVREELS